MLRQVVYVVLMATIAFAAAGADMGKVMDEDVIHVPLLGLRVLESPGSAMLLCLPSASQFQATGLLW